MSSIVLPKQFDLPALGLRLGIRVDRDLLETDVIESACWEASL